MMAREKRPPPSGEHGGGEKVVDDQSVPPKPLRSRRQVLARVPLGAVDELVISIDEHGDIDLRRWTFTGGLRFPSKRGVTLPPSLLPDVIAALERAKAAT